MKPWRTVLLSIADDAVVALLIIAILTWLVLEDLLNPFFALAIGAGGILIVAFVAYKSTKALIMAPIVGHSIVGNKGVAVTDIGDEGMVLVEGEYWKASSDIPIPKGSAVRVLEAKGLRLKVALEKNQ